jgi:putative transposase
MKDLKEENRRLKKIDAEERLKSEITQEIMAKNW